MPSVKAGCSVCGKSNQVSRPHLVCSKCKSTIYCSTTCQKEDWPSHKNSCRAPASKAASKGPKAPMTNGQYDNYLIRFQIYPGDIEDPPVWRTLSVPANCSFETLHLALQDAFGWFSVHLYCFEVNEKRGGGTVVTIEDDEALEDDDFGMRTTPSLKATKIKLYNIFEDAKYNDKSIVYVYDLGDWWEHHFTLLGTEPGTGTISCTDGGGHSIAEDAGNVRGWESVLDAYRASQPTKEQIERREWYEGMCYNGDPQGLHNGGEHRWDKDAVNQKLAGMRIR